MGEKQKLYPISYFDTFDTLLTDQLISAKIPKKILEDSLLSPYQLNDHTVQRIKTLFIGELELVTAYQNQVIFWLQRALSEDQKNEVDAFTSKLDEWTSACHSILLLVPEVEKLTIERLLEKSDLEVGLSALVDLEDTHEI